MRGTVGRQRPAGTHAGSPRRTHVYTAVHGQARGSVASVGTADVPRVDFQHLLIQQRHLLSTTTRCTRWRPAGSGSQGW